MIVQKPQKTPFSAFFANFEQRVSKNVEKHYFLTLFVEKIVLKLRKRCFLAFFANFVQGVPKNEKKQHFFHTY